MSDTAEIKETPTIAEDLVEESDAPVTEELANDADVMQENKEAQESSVDDSPHEEATSPDAQVEASEQLADAEGDIDQSMDGNTVAEAAERDSGNTEDINPSNRSAFDFNLPCEMPVEISVALGNIVVDAAEASTMSVGDVLTLQTDCPGLVKFMCNDREIGRGELVDVNGHLGVQVVHNWSRA